ncbi:FecCD family ABC transporter permease [Brevibacillus migulae]|uniref:FecCD family ABC transporter permease n=1 Tax=Brevibacillus migulae TaxID=1644114 RepID=UPI00106E05A0|nr:iron ABC transporter permease [Brevibacillus migulae]
MSRLITIRSKTGFFSFLVQKRAVLVLAVLFVFTLALFLFSMALGNNGLSFADVWTTLIGQGTEANALVIGTLRLPRVIVAVLVGAALSVSGAILQGLIRNPLASPDMIGITNGAALAAVTFITYFAGTVSIQWLPAAAFVGAGLISIVIYLLAWSKGVTSTRLVLIGIGISATASSLTMLMIILSPMSSASQAFTWLTGSIYGASWDNVYALLPWMIIFLPAAMIYARNVNVQELGDEMAQGLGASVQLHRGLLLLVCVALAGSAVAVAGAIGFIGLIAPHIARKLVGPSFDTLLPVAALIGSLMLMAADMVARTAFQPMDIPAGVFTAGVGAPFFIYLLYRNRNK